MVLLAEASTGMGLNGILAERERDVTFAEMLGKRVTRLFEINYCPRSEIYLCFPGKRCPRIWHCTNWIGEKSPSVTKSPMDRAFNKLGLFGNPAMTMVYRISMNGINRQSIHIAVSACMIDMYRLQPSQTFDNEQLSK